MKALIKKELRSYLYSVVGGLFIGVNLLFLGIYFTGYNLSSGYPTLGYTMSSAITVFLFLTPILTMRIIAEEQRQKTDMLLYTSPTSLMKIVLGKYISMLLIFAVPVLISCIYPLILSLFGKVNYKECYIAILAYFLFGAACIAIGLFISSLTENQIIAAVLTFAALFLTFLAGAIGRLFSNEIFQRIVSWFDMGKRLDNLLTGLFDLRAVVYYLSIMILMIFLTYEKIQHRRFSVSSKNIRLSAYSGTAVIVAIAAAVGLNFLVLELPDDYVQFDMTENKLFTISDESKEFLDGIDKDITIYMMSEEDRADELIKNTLNEYKSYNKHIKVKYVNPDDNPQFASGYTDQVVDSGSLIVVCGDVSKAVSQYDMYMSEMDYQTFSQKVTGYDGEGQITSAIAYVTSDDLPKLKVVTGHGEFKLEELQNLNTALNKANLDISELNLLSVDEIEDTDILFIGAPTSDYTEEDAKKVLDFLENGGKAVIATEYSQNGTQFENFNGILKNYGVSISEGLVVEPDMNMYYGNNPMYILPKVEDTQMTKSVYSEKRYIFTPYAQAIILDDEIPEGVEVYDALMTSDDSYVKKDMSEGARIDKEDGDIDGPFDIGAYITKGETVIALISSAGALTDEAYTVVGNTNISMVTDAIGSMSGNIETPYIPIKSMSTEYLTVSVAFVVLYSLVFTVLVPLVIIVLGIVLWARRRKK